MKAYLLLLREDDDEYRRLSPRALDELMKRFFDWNARLRASGAYLNCIKLTDAPGLIARIGSGSENSDAEIVSGPFINGHRTVAGMYLIRAAGAQAAQQIAAECPLLDCGGSAEIREVFSILDPA